MTYTVKEIYFTLQGEGAQTGRPAVFLRFTGCNLWTGLERDRANAVCTFCDTDFVGVGPDGGVVDTGNGQQAIVYGVILNHYDPFDGRVGSREPTLAEATNDLLAQVQRSNPYLRPRSRSMRDEVVAGAAAKSAVLAGRSPVTREEERVTVFTRALGDGHVVYSLFIAPGRDYKALSSTFTRMMQSLRVEDRARHGAH